MIAPLCLKCLREWEPGAALELRGKQDALRHRGNPLIAFGARPELCHDCWQKLCDRHYAVLDDPAQLLLRALITMDTRPGEAAAWALEGVRRYPERVDAHALRARIAEQQNEFGLAAEEWGEVLRLEPGRADAHHFRGQARMEMARRTLDQTAAERLVAAGLMDLVEAARLMGESSPEEAPPEPAPTPQPDLAPGGRQPGTAVLMLLWRAQELKFSDRWAEAEELLRQAIDLDPGVPAVYLSRAYCLRKLERYDEALAEYDRVLAMDAQNATAWLDRGAIKVLKAYWLDDRQPEKGGGKYSAEALRWFDEALADYLKAAELEHSESSQLSVLELEIILDKYREAVATAAACWSRATAPERKVVCAWLGGLAYVLACKPERQWQPFEEYLRASCPRPAWEPEQIAGYLERLERSGRVPAERMRRVRALHDAFLTHYRAAESVGD
jgi:tetratricopeptide (TPR) repeat protein